MRRNPGVLYLVEAEGTPYAKLGWCKHDLPRRIATLQTGCPYRLSLLISRAGDLSEEAELHQELAEFRVRGEWFWLCPEVRLAFDRTRKEVVYRRPARACAICEEEFVPRSPLIEICGTACDTERSRRRAARDLERRSARRCDFCGEDYRGWGERFCSHRCSARYAAALHAYARETANAT